MVARSNSPSAGTLTLKRPLPPASLGLEATGGLFMPNLKLDIFARWQALDLERAVRFGDGHIRIVASDDVTLHPGMNTAGGRGWGTHRAAELVRDRRIRLQQRVGRRIAAPRIKARIMRHGIAVLDFERILRRGGKNVAQK